MSKIEIYDRPGRYLNQVDLDALIADLKSVASECLDELPDYQCLSGRREEFERLIIAVSRSKDGKMLGFCSSYILDAGAHGQVLHLGLTCVLPLARRMGLTHKLTSKVVTTYLLRYSLFKQSWVSNVACVLSSLGNVALHFDDVYPSPYNSSPSKEHIAIAKMIDGQYRHELYIRDEAKFNEKNFIFEESVLGNQFQKSVADKRYHHRSKNLTNFYANLMNFKRGDEVLQIGKVSLLTFPRYLLKNFTKRWKRDASLAPTSQSIA
jgi:hypothetical protein